MKYSQLLLGFTFSFLLSCGGEEVKVLEEPINDEVLQTEKVEVVYTDTEWKEFQIENTEKQATIRLTGYIGPLGSSYFSSGTEMHFDLYPRRNQSSGFRVAVYLPSGTGPNQMRKLKENYGPNDLEIHCNNEDIASTGDLVTITGKVRGTYEDYISISLNEIGLESAPKEEMIPGAALFDRAVELQQKIISDTTISSIYCYMDGKLSLPTSLFSLNDSYSLDFNQRNNKEVKSISVPIGDGPDQMKDLPNGYGKDDLIIQDYEGNSIDRKDKVRVYGTWNRTSYSDRGYFRMEEIVKQ